MSEAVTKFDLELLESETALAGGGFKEEWTTEWNSDEKNCIGTGEPFCLPRAIKLSMTLSGKDTQSVADSQVINLCVAPCNQEIFK